jgi:hypothetical protein
VRQLGRRDLGLLVGVALATVGGFPTSGRFLFSMAGLFVVSLVSNATPFFGASYTLIATSELISIGPSIQSFVAIVAITAIGAALGKIVIYGSAKVFQKQLAGNRNVKLLEPWLQNRRFLLAVFVAAVIPLLPLDDYIFIGAGGSKGKFYPMFSVTVGAKLVKSAVEIWLEFYGIVNIAHFTRHVLGLTGFQFSIILSIGMVALGIFLFAYDWGRFLRPVPQQGV